MEELECGAGAPGLFLCEAVVSVTLVFGGFTHGEEGELRMVVIRLADYILQLRGEVE